MTPTEARHTMWRGGVVFVLAILAQDPAIHWVLITYAACCVLIAWFVLEYAAFRWCRWLSRRQPR